jgi:hypothetical protein
VESRSWEWVWDHPRYRGRRIEYTSYPELESYFGEAALDDASDKIFISKLADSIKRIEPKSIQIDEYELLLWLRKDRPREDLLVITLEKQVIYKPAYKRIDWIGSEK